MKHVRNNRHLLAGHKKFGFTDSGPILKRKSLGLFSNTSGLFSSDTVNTAVENDLRMESNDVIGLLKSDLYYDGMVIERVGYQS
jgi:hypothetical protein